MANDIAVRETPLLVKLDEGRRALAEARTLHDAKKVRDVAKAAADLMKQQRMSQEVIFDAMELKLWAERRMGQFLAGTVNRGGDRKSKSHDVTLIGLPEEVGRMQSSRWQRVAKVDEAKFTGYIRDAREKGREPTTQGVMRMAKEKERQQMRDDNAKIIAKGKCTPITTADFSTIVIDPPWKWSDEGDKSQFGRGDPAYATLSFEGVRDFEPCGDGRKVGDFAAKNAHLYLWITNRSLPKGFALLEAWGFRYVTCLTWRKPSIGMGNYFRGSSEQILFGVRGSLPLLRNDVGTWFQAKRQGKHSTKPEEFYQLVESCSPGPWLELFARKERKGWTAAGAEL